MSAVAVVVLFVCCALIIRALGAREQARARRSRRTMRGGDVRVARSGYPAQCAGTTEGGTAEDARRAMMDT
ncbi:hypothetical protein [Nocardia gipuzkoensis]